MFLFYKDDLSFIYINEPKSKEQEKVKPFFAFIAVLTLILSLGFAETGKDIQKDTKIEEAPREVRQYTAYNIWRPRTWLMRCINYKHGNDFISAGTEVSDVGITEDAHGNQRISFVTVSDKRKYGIY